MWDASLADRIRRDCLEQQGAMQSVLEELVAIESPSHEPKSQRAVQQALRAQLEAIDYRVRHVPGTRTGGVLLARPRLRPRPAGYQLLIGHCDTVWPRNTLAEMPLRTEDGVMKGPGVYDMKCGLVQLLFALRVLQTLELSPPLVPVALINSDEELGSGESVRTICRAARGARRAFVLEPSLGRDGRLKTARKGVGHFRVTVSGKAAHAGLDPAAGASAILELSHVIQQLFALNEPAVGTTVNVGVIDGGLRPNVIAPQSRAEVDVRVLTAEEGVRIEAAIAALRPRTPNTRLTVEGGIGRPPMESTPANHALWLQACDAGQLLGLDLDQATAGGGSDGNFTSQYTATLDGLGAVGDGAHASHEFVQLDQIPLRCALLALLLLAPVTKESMDTAVSSRRHRTTAHCSPRNSGEFVTDAVGQPVNPAADS